MSTRPARTMNRAAAVLALGALVASTGPPAGATHGGIHPTFRAEKTYFHCVGPTKIENVNLILGGPTSWDTNAPTTSFTQGAGCGALDPGVVRGGNPATIYDAVFRGKFTGNIRDMTIDLHNLLLSRVRTGATFTVRVRMLIDETQVFPETAGKTIAITPALSSTGLSEMFVFSIPDLGCTKDVLDEKGNVIDVIAKGFATEDGDGTTDHDIRIAIDSNSADRASAWVWDASEVPSGISFNPATLSTNKVGPTAPATC